MHKDETHGAVSVTYCVEGLVTALSTVFNVEMKKLTLRTKKSVIDLTSLCAFFSRT